MLIDTLSVSRWYALNLGHSVKPHCRHCNQPLTHFRAYEKDASGILSRCETCRKEFLRLRVHDKTPFNRHTPVDNQVFGRVRKGAGGVERFNGGVVEFLHP